MDFIIKKKDRGQARNSIINAAIAYSKANTSQGKSRVARYMSDCLDIIRGFYASGISKKECILASEMVDAISESTQQIIEEKSQAIVSKIEGLGDSLVSGSLFSMDKAIQLAETGNLSAIQSGLKKMFDHISLEHPLSPHFGYTYVDGELRSKALTKDAKVLFPPRYVFTGAIRFGDTYYNDSDGDPIDYAYRHQLPITMEVSKAVKYLGDKPDPAPSEVDQLQGNVLLAIPPNFLQHFRVLSKLETACFLSISFLEHRKSWMMEPTLLTITSKMLIFILKSALIRNCQASLISKLV